MCSVEAKRLQSSCDHMYSTPTASAASRSDDAAERHLRVAVGFSPRIREEGDSRRYATRVSFPAKPWVKTHGYHHIVATRRPPISRPTRGLKPTATITSSLRDEICLRSFCSSP